MIKCFVEMLAQTLEVNMSPCRGRIAVDLSPSADKAIAFLCEGYLHVRWHVILTSLFGLSDGLNGLTNIRSC
jgi:expansin (peptidoglycan-binding protein)